MGLAASGDRLNEHNLEVGGDGLSISHLRISKADSTLSRSVNLATILDLNYQTHNTNRDRFGWVDEMRCDRPERG